MRRFIFSLLLFLSPFILVVGICEIAPRITDNDYKYKNKWLSANASKVQVLNLGSSHTYYGIDPKVFDLVEFNAAHVSQDLQYDHFIFTKFIDKMDSLKYLILPISYFTPFSSMESGDEWWRVKYYCIYYHCPYHPFEAKYNLEISNGIHPGVVFKDILGSNSNRYCTAMGQGTGNELENRDNGWMSSGLSRANYHTMKSIDSDMLDKNLQWASDIISQCQIKGIKVILLNTPTYYTYRENLNAEQLEGLIEFCSELQITYSNVEYFNMLSDPRFGEEDFFDADHLNEFGAIKLSKILNEYIMEDIQNL